MMDEEQAATVSAASTLHDEGIDTTQNTANRKDHASETRSTVLSPSSDALNSMNIEKEATFSENRHDEHPFNTDSSHVFDEQDGEDLDEQKVQDATTGQAELTRTTSSIKYIEGLKLYFLMASLTLIFFLVMIDMSIIATAVPKITTDFNSLEDVGWYGTAYLLASASLQPLAGKIYSNFRSKYIFLTCFFIFEVGSLLCGVAQSSNMLIVGRAVAGIGCAGIMNGALTILSASMPLHKRPKYFGIMMGFAMMGIVFGPILGGAFTSYVNWRWCFYINLPVGGVAGLILLIFIDVPELFKPRTDSIKTIVLKKLDIMGFLLFAPAAIQVFLALEWGGSKYPWSDAKIIGLFCGSGATAILFGLWESRQGDNAMVPFSVLMLRTVWTSCTTMLLFYGCLQIVAFYLPIYFQTVRGRSAIIGGVSMLPSVLSQLVSTVSSGALVGKLGYYLPWIVTCSVLSTVAIGLLSMLSPTSSAGQWIGYQVLLGFGRGLGMQMPMIAVQNSIQPKFVPVAMAMLSFAQTFGGAVFLAIGETILSNQLRLNIPKYAPEVNPAVIIAAGGSGPAVRAAVSNDPAALAGTLLAYSESVDAVFWFAAGASAVMFVTSWGMGWKDIRKKDSPQAVPAQKKTDIENTADTSAAPLGADTEGTTSVSGHDEPKESSA